MEISFSEFSLDMDRRWINSLRIYTGVKNGENDLTMKTRPEWDRLFKELKNKQLTN
jgi:hypothetical protein